jgi:hypothetical protein
VRRWRMKVKVCKIINFSYPDCGKRCLGTIADYFLKETEGFKEINSPVRSVKEVLNFLTGIILIGIFDSHKKAEHIEYS